MRRLIVYLALGAAIAFVLFETIPPYPRYITARIAVAVVAAVGLNLLMGNARLFSLSTPAFLAVGAYGIVLLINAHVPLVVAAVVVIAVSWGIGWLLGTVSLRLAGFYLALVTLGFLLTIDAVLQNGGAVFGSGYGFATPTVDLFGQTLDIDSWMIISVIGAIGVVLLVKTLTDSRIGRAWRAMGHNEVLAQTSGIDLLRLKTSTFALSSAIGAGAGCLYAFVQGAISPANFTAATMVSQLAYVVIGGLGSVLGSVLGPAVLLALPEFLRGLGDKLQIVYGVALLLVLALAPTGLAGFVERILAQIAAALERPRMARVRKPLYRAADIARWTVDGKVAPVSGTEARGALATLPVRTQATLGKGELAASIECDHVVVRYGGLAAVDGLTLRVRPGSLHGLIGANGAGKTTALNAMTGVVQLAGGNIRVGVLAASAGGRLSRRALPAAGVARTFQTPLVVPSLSALENVMVGLHSFTRGTTVTAALRLASVSKSERWAGELSAETLRRVGFDRDPRIRADRLGFADLRKVELARALVTEPRIVLLDEPTSGLELSYAESMMEQIRVLQAEAREPLTVVLVEHNVPIVFGWCHEVTAMDMGKDLITGSPAEVREHAGVQNAYLGQVAQGV